MHSEFILELVLLIIRSYDSEIRLDCNVKKKKVTGCSMLKIATVTISKKDGLYLSHCTYFVKWIVFTIFVAPEVFVQTSESQFEILSF